MAEPDHRCYQCRDFLLLRVQGQRVGFCLRDAQEHEPQDQACQRFREDEVMAFAYDRAWGYDRRWAEEDQEP